MKGAHLLGDGEHERSANKPDGGSGLVMYVTGRECGSTVWFRMDSQVGRCGKSSISGCASTRTDYISLPTRTVGSPVCQGLSRLPAID